MVDCIRIHINNKAEAKTRLYYLIIDLSRYIKA